MLIRVIILYIQVGSGFHDLGVITIFITFRIINTCFTGFYFKIKVFVLKSENIVEGILRVLRPNLMNLSCGLNLSRGSNMDGST